MTRTPLSRSKGQRSTCRGGAYCGGLPHSLLLSKVTILSCAWYDFCECTSNRSARWCYVYSATRCCVYLTRLPKFTLQRDPFGARSDWEQSVQSARGRPAVQLRYDTNRLNATHERQAITTVYHTFAIMSSAKLHAERTYVARTAQ